MITMMRLLREAISAGHEAERGLDYRWDMMNKHARLMPDDDLSMNQLDRRGSVVYKATREMQKIMDDLMKEEWK